VAKKIREIFERDWAEAATGKEEKKKETKRIIDATAAFA
jgi:hypothetical protein